MKARWIGISMMAVMLFVGSASASFYMNGEAVAAPGTFSWTSQDMTGWYGVDATAVTGDNVNSAMFDGNANCGDGDPAPISVPYWSSLVTNPLIGIYDLGQSYQVSTIELQQGSGNGWWGNLGGTVRVSDTSSDWSSASEVGSLSAGNGWTSPPGSSAFASFDVNASIRYVLISTSFSGGNQKLDEMNIYATPEPATLSLLTIGGLSIFLRQKR